MPLLRRTPRRSGRRGRTRSGLVAALVTVLLTAVLAPPARADGEVDIAVSLTPAASAGPTGSTAVLVATVADVAGSPSGPVTVYVSSDLPVVALDAPGASCAPPDGCSVPDIGPGGSVSVAVTVRLDQAGDRQVSVGAYPTDSYDVVDGNNTATATVSVLTPTALSLRASALRTPAGRVVTLTARLTDGSGAPLDGGVVITRQGPTDSAPVALTDLSYLSAGVTSATDRPTGRAVYRASAAAGYGQAASSAVPVTVEVGFGVSARISPTVVPPGSPLALAVSVLPAKAGARVAVDERVGAGPWRPVATPALTAAGGARLALRATGTHGALGAHTFRVRMAADADHFAGLGQSLTTVTVTGKGDARAWVPLGGTRARPVHWNPCTPITYYLNPAHVPATGLGDLQEAVRRLHLASGLTFRYGGTTTRRPSAAGPGAGRILVAWATPAEAPGRIFPGDAGRGGYTSTDGRATTGSLVVNRAWSATAPAGFGAGVPQGLVLMHELGHVVGLDHSTDPWSVMRPGHPLPAAVWGAADYAGLHKVGRAAGCLH